MPPILQMRPLSPREGMGVPDTMENIQGREDLDPGSHTGSSALCGLSEVTSLSDWPGSENEDDNLSLQTDIGEEETKVIFHRWEIVLSTQK